MTHIEIDPDTDTVVLLNERPHQLLAGDHFDVDGRGTLSIIIDAARWYHLPAPLPGVVVDATGEWTTTHKSPPS